MNTINIQSALQRAQHALAKTSSSAVLDAEVLLGYCLHKPRSFLRAWPEQPLSPHQYTDFFNLIQQRHQGVPVAYLVGVREFWSRDFYVTPDVLIPRPETELLIETGLNLIPANQPCKIIDLGTGSGNIAITLAAERPLSQVIAVDISAASLDIAKQNARLHATNNISFRQSNWFDNIADKDFSLIISNPPYVAANDPHLTQGDLRFEPEQALLAPDQGLAAIKKITEHAYPRLLPHGRLLFEHGYDQPSAVQAILKKHYFQQVITYTDLSNNPRVTVGTKLS